MKHLLKTLPVLAVLAALLVPMPTMAADTLDDAIANIANRIEAYLKEKNELQINIRDFSGPPNSSSGRKIKNLLEAELEKRDIKVALLSNWEVRGDFQVNTDGKFATVAVITRLVNAQGAEVADFRQRVSESVDDLKDVLDIAQPPGFDGESLVAAVTEGAQPGNSSNPPAGAADPNAESTAPGTSGNQPAPPVSSGSSPPANNPGTVSPGTVSPGTPPAGSSPNGSPQTAQLPDAQTRDDLLKTSLLKPGFFSVNETTIAASDRSPYRVQVKVRRAGASIFEAINIEEVANGLAYCDLQEGDQYSVVVTNTAPHDVGVELMIDGINSLVFSEITSFRETGKWLIRGTNNNGGVPYSARIDGWYRNPETVDSFQVSSEPDAVASELGFPAKIGTITATFYGAWKDGDPVHPLEAQLAASLGQSRGLGTARGETIRSRSETAVSIFGTHPLASVSIRYVNPDPPVDLPIEAAN